MNKIISDKLRAAKKRIENMSEKEKKKRAKKLKQNLEKTTPILTEEESRLLDLNYKKYSINIDELIKKYDNMSFAELPKEDRGTLRAKNSKRFKTIKKIK